MEQQSIQKLALIISANCVRKSTFDQCHDSGKINDQQYQQFNKELSDRLYTFLTYLLQKPADEYSEMMEAMAEHFPETWDQPELSDALMKHVSAAAQKPAAAHKKIKS